MDDEELVRGGVEVIVGVHRVAPHGLDHADGVEVRLDLRGVGRGGGEHAFVDDERLLLDGGVWDEPRRWDLVPRDAEGRKRGQGEEGFARVHSQGGVACDHAHGGDARVEFWAVVVVVLVVARVGVSGGMAMRGYGYARAGSGGYDTVREGAPGRDSRRGGDIYCPPALLAAPAV